MFRRHFLTSFRGVLFWILMAAIGVVPSFIWPTSTNKFWMWLACFGVGFVGWLYSWILWHFSYYLLTNERLRQVRQKGFFRRSVVDLDLTKVLSASYGVPGLLGSICNYGTILIQTGAGDLILSRVSHPAEIHAELQDAIHIANKKELE